MFKFFKFLQIPLVTRLWCALRPGTETGADGQPILRTGQVVEFDVALDDRGRAATRVDFGAIFH